jgi:anoctamin-10/anoctamin-7
MAEIEMDSKGGYDAPGELTRAESLPDQDRELTPEEEKAYGDNTYFEWDYVMVFKVGNKKQQEEFRHSSARTINRIRKSGLKTYLYKSVQEDEIYCLMGATERRLRREADRVDYDLPLDTDQVLAIGRDRGMKLVKSIDSEDEIDRLTDRALWRQMYGKFESYDPEYPRKITIYKKQGTPDDPRHKDSFFRSIDRIRLIFGILQADPLLGGAGLKVYSMLRDQHQSLCAAFPLHDPIERAHLEKTWANSWWPMFTQPLNDIRNYFGEKIAFYFAFLEYYCKWLIFLTIGGVPIWLWQMGTGQKGKPHVDVEILPFAGAVVAVWATLFLEFWKRQEATLRADWGMTNFKQKEQPRPEFDGERVRSPVDGSLIKYFPWYRRIARFFFSQTVIWGLIVIVLGLVVSIFILRREMRKLGTRGLIITSVINAVQIQVLNFVYALVANQLNNWENHRTQSDWENALIAKTFLFKFINSYNSLFYIAFFKRWDLGCNDELNGKKIDPDCLGELSIQLAIIFGSAIIVNNTIELSAPIIKNILRIRQNAAADESGLGKKTESRPEEEFVLEVYTTLADFDEMVVQFGYVTLFVVAFPLAPFLALFNNYFEIRLDAKKLTALCQRPNPLGAASIGTWLDILTIVSFIAVLINTLIVIFFSSLISGWVGRHSPDAYYAWFYKAAIFVITERCIVLCKFFLSYVVDDVPREVQEHCAREQYLVDVLINGQEEETEETLKRRNTLLMEYEHFTYKAIPKKFPTEHFASDPKFIDKPHVEQNTAVALPENERDEVKTDSPAPQGD